MRTSVSAKRCPECGKATTLQDAVCTSCGHRYRTRFVDTIQRTQALQVVVMPQPAVQPLRRSNAARTFQLAFLSSFLLVALAGGLLWLGWNAGHSPAGAQLSVSASPPVSQSGRGERLFNKIGIAMSLYDLDQAAGGTGRVILGSDPHTLLLSYDYPNQSVKVSLNRTDVTGDDYRVQAVSLYQGKTLLLRHADLD